MRKIIAISGTHGSGKSTIAYSLCAKMKLAGKNVVVLDELARKCPFEINKGAGTITPIWLTCKQLLEELELQENFEYVIVDRSALDAYCYNLAIHDKSTEIMDNYLPVICSHMRACYYKVYIPDMVAFNFQIDDGVRDLDPKFREKVQTVLIGMFDKLELPYTIIPTIETIYRDLGLV